MINIFCDEKVDVDPYAASPPS